MPSPLGHVLAGQAVARLFRADSRRARLSTVLWAVAADVDLVPGLLKQNPDAEHKKITHSFGAAVVAGAMAGLWGRLRGEHFGGASARATAAYASHVALDLLGEGAADGMPIAWPLSAWRVTSPVVWFEAITSQSAKYGFCKGLLRRRNLAAVAREVVTLLPAVWLAGAWGGAPLAKSRGCSQIADSR